MLQIMYKQMNIYLYMQPGPSQLPMPFTSNHASDDLFNEFCNDLEPVPGDSSMPQDYTVPRPEPRHLNVFPGSQQIFQPAPTQFDVPPMPTPQYAPPGYVSGSQVQGYPPLTDPSIHPMYTTRTVGPAVTYKNFLACIHIYFNS